VNFNKFEGKEDEERREKDEHSRSGQDEHREHRGTEVHRGRFLGRQSIIQKQNQQAR
jgi:hypothetical protein